MVCRGFRSSKRLSFSSILTIRSPVSPASFAIKDFGVEKAKVGLINQFRIQLQLRREIRSVVCFPKPIVRSACPNTLNHGFALGYALNGCQTEEATGKPTKTAGQKACSGLLIQEHRGLRTGQAGYQGRDCDAHGASFALQEAEHPGPQGDIALGSARRRKNSLCEIYRV